ncbi:MAG: phosphopantetheine-binding protein [Candidatus Adiutrix sp.]|jgi:acyl carrier protein|nr:phosphopantetheine-binding protein [Candidatus Adiutrix sp.]
MMDERIWGTVTRALAEEFELKPEQMVPEARIKEDLGLDSLDMVDMVIVLETAFDFKIQDKAALKEIQTLADVMEFILITIEQENGQAANA